MNGNVNNLANSSGKDDEHYRLLAEYTNDRICTIDADGRITYLSPTALQRSGYAPPEIIGHGLMEFVHPDDRNTAKKTLVHMIKKTAKTILAELRFLYKDGSWHNLEMVGCNLLDNAAINEIVIIFFDITNSITTKHERLKGRNQLQNLLDLYRRADARIHDIEAFVIEECVKISQSPLGFFGFVNAEETKMETHLWSKRAMADCNVDFKPVVFDLPKAGIWAEAIQTREPLIVNDYQKPDPRKKGYPKGHVQIQRLLSIPIIKGGKVVAVMAVANKKKEYTRSDILHLSLFIENMWDLLKRKEAENALLKLNEKLEKKMAERTRELFKAQEKLVRQEKLSVLGQLAGTVGHELRNPFGVMSNAIYFLKTVLPDADDMVMEYLDIIQREIDNSLKIITDLLDFARTKHPRVDPVRVSQLIEQSIGQCAIPENINVKVIIPDMLEPLNVDPSQIIQVLQNLITNAVQAMPEGGLVSILVRKAWEKQDKCQLPLAASYAEIDVKDTGSGISPENMEKLFQPLFTTKTKGIGLGLVVCKNLVEANRGTISVDSHFGKGTTFTIRLPIAKEKK